MDGEKRERTSANSARITKDYPVRPEELSDAVTRAISRLPKWSVEGNKGGDAEVQAIRTTGLFRFKDDISISVEETDEGSRLVADSASRVGKGDLGQNPRNLEELISAIEDELR